MRLRITSCCEAGLNEYVKVFGGFTLSNVSAVIPLYGLRVQPRLETTEMGHIMKSPIQFTNQSFHDIIKCNRSKQRRLIKHRQL